MAKVTIDGKEYEVDAAKNLLEECLSEGLDLPYFCWHPSMGSVGACRQCAVVEYADEKDTRGRVVMSCMTTPRDGGRYSIKAAHGFRGQVIESLMTSHPHDCPVCEEGGECHLQDMTVMSGHTYRRYAGKKVTHRNQYLGPFLTHEMNRCITCYRCVRFYNDYAGGTDLTAMASHNHTYFGRYEEGTLENEFSGNLAEVCPTGVFTDKPFSKRYVRKWDLQTAPSVCTGCSVGCNILPGERYGTLRRVVNRYHDEINGYFICDRGRFGAEFVNSPERITVSMTRKSHQADPCLAEPEAALERLGEIAGAGAIGIGSPRASLEANFALRELVGEDRFYAGVDDAEFAMTQQILDIYENAPVNIASVRDIEKSDAVLILCEDVTNTAARLALALRQSVRNEGFDLARKQKFPLWHDAAVRKLTMDAKSPLYILSPAATRLDDVARKVFIADAERSADIAFAIANAIDASAPSGSVSLSEEEKALVHEISDNLKTARQPLVISGSNCGSIRLLDAAANVATALSNKERKCNLALLPADANSLGLAMLMRGNRDKSLGAAFGSGAKQAIVLENDLYRRAPGARVDEFISGLEQLAVLDSLKHRTGEQANLVLATATFAESAGTYVNYEGRAQHYYSVFKPVDSIKPASRWLSPERSLHDLLQACAEALPGAQALTQVAPGPEFNVAGMRAPRQPFRYSGRTAMRAHVSVHEPKAEQDEDGVLNYSMEGVPVTRDSTVYGLNWAPGWNSNQSVLKFQEEIGGKLRQGAPGIRLIGGQAGEKRYFEYRKADQGGEGLTAFPLYHLLGSGELSGYAPSIQARATSAYVALSPADAEKLGLGATDGVQVEGNGSVPYILRDSVQPGTVGVSVGLKGLNYHDLGARPALKKAENWTRPESWNYSNIIVSDKRSA